MQALLETLVKALVDDPDAIDIRQLQDGEWTKYEIRVAPEDTGKVIGKQGRTIRAVRQLVKAAAIRSGERVNVDVV